MRAEDVPLLQADTLISVVTRGFITGPATGLCRLLIRGVLRALVLSVEEVMLRRSPAWPVYPWADCFGGCSRVGRLVPWCSSEILGAFPSLQGAR